MKTIYHFKTAKDPLLHIETEGGIINVRVGLSEPGTYRHLTHIEILPDINGDGCGNPAWRIADDETARAMNIRLVQNG
jgi:hypothetical protein